MSVNLKEYKEEIRVGRQREILPGRWAFRLDEMEDPQANKRDMRKKANLDSLSSCDYYLQTGDNRDILIEETELTETIRRIEAYLGRVGGDDAFIRDTVRERVVRENTLKVCGSLLLMCRMGLGRRDARPDVWIVVSGDSAAVGAFRWMDPGDKLKDALLAALCGDSKRQSFLQGGLRSAKMANKVELITVPELRERLPGPD